MHDDDHEPSASAPEEATATFLFADIAGYTALTEAHGDEQAADLVAEFFEAVNEELPVWGGTHVKTIGDALMLRIPDPAKAVQLGLRITHELLQGHGAPEVRVGLHHGAAIERGGDYFGAAVNLAARVAAVAIGGEVLLIAHTAALAPSVGGIFYQPRGRQTLRNIREPVDLFAAVPQGQLVHGKLPIDPGLPNGGRPRACSRPTHLRRDRLLLLHSHLRRRVRDAPRTVHRLTRRRRSGALFVPVPQTRPVVSGS